MDYLTFTKVKQSSKSRNLNGDGYIKWHACEQDTAIVSLTSKAGIRCFLHIGAELRGSIFDFCCDQQMVTLVVDYVIMEKNRVKQMNFLLEYVGVQ